EQAAAGRRNQIVEVLVAAFRVVLLAEGDARSGAQEAGRDERLVAPGLELVPGELLLKELIVRLVLVERANHVVAIAPRVGPIVVLLEAARIGVTRDVQPMPAPSLAVVRRREQRVDETRPGVRRVVREKRGGFGRTRRQANQIEIGPTEQREPGRGRSRLEALVAARLLEETVDGVVEACGGFGDGRLDRQL